MVDETGRDARLGSDALHRGAGKTVLHDRGAQPIDDLPAARRGETGASHGVNWLAVQPIYVNTHSAHGKDGCTSPALW
jgi:hypothetical protein